MTIVVSPVTSPEVNIEIIGSSLYAEFNVKLFAESSMGDKPTFTGGINLQYATNNQSMCGSSHEKFSLEKLKNPTSRFFVLAMILSYQWMCVDST